MKQRLQPIAKPLTEIRITDAYICKAVEQEQLLRGDKSASVTAARLITERLVELDRDPVVGGDPSPDEKTDDAMSAKEPSSSAA